jgi:hypothetical protein
MAIYVEESGTRVFVAMKLEGGGEFCQHLTPTEARDLADNLTEIACLAEKANTFKLPTGIGAVIHYKDRHQNTYVRVSNSTWRYVATGTHYSDEDFRNVSADDYEILSEGVELD